MNLSYIPSGVFRRRLRMGEMKIRSRGRNADTGMQQGPRHMTVILVAAVFPPSFQCLLLFQRCSEAKKEKNQKLQHARFVIEMEGVIKTRYIFYQCFTHDRNGRPTKKTPAQRRIKVIACDVHGEGHRILLLAIMIFLISPAPLFVFLPAS